jgi:hypothetical protein
MFYFASTFFCPRIRVFLAMVVLVSLLTRNARVTVRAFTTGKVPASRRLVTHQARPLLLGSLHRGDGAKVLIASAQQQNRWLSSSSRNSMAVDEDLDSALDSILGEAFEEAEGGREPGTHIEGSRPIPKTLVEEVCMFVACISSLLSMRITLKRHSPFPLGQSC